MNRPPHLMLIPGDRLDDHLPAPGEQVAFELAARLVSRNWGLVPAVDNVTQEPCGFGGSVHWPSRGAVRMNPMVA
jgi:hypothetical protein